MGPATWLAIAALAAVIIAGVFFHGRLARDRNRVRQGYADVDAQLKRRADLVPQLLDTARIYAFAEKALFTTVAGLCTDALQARPVDRFPLERALGESLNRVVLLQDNYPELKADLGFRALATQLMEVERQIELPLQLIKGGPRD